MQTTIEARKKLTASKATFISCVVPVHSEAENVHAFITQLQAKLAQLTHHFEIIIVDDGSKDDTVKIIEDKLLNNHIKLIAFSRNFGKESALTAGLQYCKGDIAILIDADFQHPFELFDTFLARWTEGYDMAYGVRCDRNSETPSKRWFTKTFYRLLGLLSEVKIPPDAGDFRLLDRSVIDALNQCDEHSRFMKGLYAWVGFKSIAIPYKPQERQAGKSSWSFLKLFNLALTGIISFSDAPLRVWSLMGIFVSSIAFLYALGIVFKTLAFGADTPGYATTIVAIMFFGGIQLISIGILGEYLARVFREVKNRPSFIIAKTVGIEKREKNLPS